MTRAASPQTIRKAAAVAMRQFSQRSVQTPAPAIEMAELSHVARHLLRFLDKAQPATAQTLKREVGQESDMLPAMDVLLRHGLVELVHRTYRMTPQGVTCVSDQKRRPSLTH